MRICSAAIPICRFRLRGFLVSSISLWRAGCCYEIFQHLESTEIQISGDTKQEATVLSGLGSRIWDKDPAKGYQLDGLIAHLEMLAVESGFVNAQKSGNTITRLRRLFMRHQLDETEVQILRGLLRAIEGE